MRGLTSGLVLLVVACLPLHAQDASHTDANAPAAAAQPDGASTPFTNGAWELLATAGAGDGIVLAHSEGGHRYAVQAVSMGRVLSGLHGPGALRGSFTWALEVVPLFSQWAPVDTYGVGVSPIVWRWNFAPYGRRVSTYAELAGGGLWTTDAIPVGTTPSNFTAHAAYGLRYFFHPQQALVINYWFHHISNGNRLERNPGVNSHALQLGYSYVWRH